MMDSFASDCEQPGHAGDITKKEAEVGILPSHGWYTIRAPNDLEPLIDSLQAFPLMFLTRRSMADLL
jgi:hypothetical protein